MGSVWNGNGKGMEKLTTYQLRSILLGEIEWNWNGIGMELEWKWNGTCIKNLAMKSGTEIEWKWKENGMENL